jgi:hypothetical protein
MPQQEVSNPVVYPDDFPRQVASSTQDDVSRLDAQIRQALYCTMKSSRRAMQARIVAEKYGIILGERLPREGVPDSFWSEIQSLLPISATSYQEMMSLVTSHSSSITGIQSDVTNLRSRVGVLESR